MAITVRLRLTREEVALALPDPGMPLKVRRYPVTPIGMDHVLVDFDVPEIDAAAHEVRVDGRVRAPLVLTLEDLRSRPAASMPVMMECAGSGRARLGQQLSDFGQGVCLRGPTGAWDLEGLFIRLGAAIDSVGANRVVLDTRSRGQAPAAEVPPLDAGGSDRGVARPVGGGDANAV